MNNKQALKHLAHMATNCLEGVQKGNIVAHKQIEALNIGIQALQEKLERDKGCGHCRVDENHQTDKIVFQSDNHLVEVQLCYGMLEVIYKIDEEVEFHLDADINYCPMCGRKLVEV